MDKNESEISIQQVSGAKMDYSEWIGRGLKLFNISIKQCFQKAALTMDQTNLDTRDLLQLLHTHWYRLGQVPMTWYEKSLFSEIRHIRNSWAHQATFNANDTYRALDTLERAVALLDVYDVFCKLREVKQHLLPHLLHELQQPMNHRNLVSFSPQQQRVFVDKHYHNINV
jgi:hypothetical protein